MAVRRPMSATNRSSHDVRPEGGARCVSSARRDLCGGRGVILVPTATTCQLSDVPKPTSWPARLSHVWFDMPKAQHTTNYRNTFIRVSDDCPVETGVVPPPRGGKQTVAGLQYATIFHEPYTYITRQMT